MRPGKRATARKAPSGSPRAQASSTEVKVTRSDSPMISSRSASPDTMRARAWPSAAPKRSEEHTSELQSLMRISYAVYCLKKKKKNKTNQQQTNHKCRQQQSKNQKHN